MEGQKQPTPGTDDRSATGDLTVMTDKQLIDRLEGLHDAVPEEEESANDFLNHQKEIKIIEAELEYRRKYGTSK
jgi:hypothetical protein